MIYGLYRIYSWGGDWQRSSEITERLLRLANESGDPAQLLEAHRAMGVDLIYRGDFTGGLAHSERSVAIFDPAQHASHAYQYGTDTRVYCLMFVGISSLLLGHPDRSVNPVGEALEFARTGRHPFSLAFALGWAALFHRFRGDVERTRELADELIALSTERELGIFLALGKIFRGWSLTTTGEGEAGHAEMRQGLAEFEPTGAKLGRSYLLGWDGEALASLGQTEEGIHRLDEALAWVKESGERLYEAELYRLKGTILLTKASPDTDGAEACLQRALDVAHHQQGRVWELRAALSLARLWHSQGKTTDGCDLLAPTYGWFTEGSDTADLKEAKAFLDELS